MTNRAALHIIRHNAVFIDTLSPWFELWSAHPHRTTPTPSNPYVNHLFIIDHDPLAQQRRGNILNGNMARFYVSRLLHRPLHPRPTPNPFPIPGQGDTTPLPMPVRIQAVWPPWQPKPLEPLRFSLWFLTDERGHTYSMHPPRRNLHNNTLTNRPSPERPWPDTLYLDRWNRPHGLPPPNQPLRPFPVEILDLSTPTTPQP